MTAPEPEALTPEPQVIIALNIIPAVLDPDNPVIYNKTLKHGDPFVVLYPAQTPDGQKVMMVESSGGMNEVEIAVLLADIANVIYGHYAPATHDCPPDAPRSVDADGTEHCALCGGEILPAHEPETEGEQV